jgi:phytanoyl-CoA hydroxylase
MRYIQYQKQFDKDGYVIVRDFLSAEDFAELNHNLDRYIDEIVPTLPDNKAFYQDKSRPETLKQMQHMGECDPYFRHYLEHPRWTALAETLLGEPIRFKDPQWFGKPPLTMHITPPHQDNFYFCLRPPKVLTMWLALDHVNEETGCMRYVPGSHSCGLRPHHQTEVVGFSQGISDYGPEDEAAEVLIQLQPGDLVCHHGELIHRADANRSPTLSRRAFALIAEGLSCQRNEEAFEVYLASASVQHKKAGLKM